MANKKTILTEFYIKNVIASLFNHNLYMLKKSEAPDFYNNDYLLEVVSLIEEDVAKPHSLFEKYKKRPLMKYLRMFLK